VKRLWNNSNNTALNSSSYCHRKTSFGCWVARYKIIINIYLAYKKFYKH
jgi:hypothetical protein